VLKNIPTLHHSKQMLNRFFFSFPVTVVDGKASIVKGLVINEFSKQKLKLSEAELKEEKEAVEHLF